MSRLKIHHHADAGLPHHEIARLTGCCERTVRNVLDEGPPSPAEVAADQRADRGPGAPSKTAPYAERDHAVHLEVAEQALREHVARTGDDLAPYSVVLSQGSLPSRDNEFIDMGIVRDEMRMRAGRMVSLNRVFRVQQWLAAEAFIAARWPQHQTCTVSYDMLSGLDFEGLSRIAPSRRRRR